ncbi:MAG: HD domain-containing protein [Chloroflexi bacterium]|nr:HD domain-containing protein [Chloroflexota bacterium]
MGSISIQALLDPSVRALCERLERAFGDRGFALHLVGGPVRDVILGAPEAEDLDFTTDAQPPDSRQALLRAHPDAVFDIGERFGTIGAVFRESKVEVTTYRAEAYEAGSRKPSVGFHGSLEADLARRDFTINAIAFRVSDGVIVDPFNGQGDLRQGLVRAVGDPHERFAEDPLRILRAVRFATRLDFALDDATAAAAQQQAPTLDSISRERVRDELNKLLVAPRPSRGVQLLCDLGLAAHTLPDLLAMRGMHQEAGRHKDVFFHTLHVIDRIPPRLPLRWAALLHDIAKPRTLRVENGQVHFFGHDRVGEKMARSILDGLRQDGLLINRVGRLVGLHLRANAYESDWTDGAVRRFVREVCDDVLEDLLHLSRADVTSGLPERRLAIARRVGELELRIRGLRAEADIARLASPLDGADLMALFERGPGPWIRPLKDHLLDLVLDGQLRQDDREAAVPIARRLYAELGLDQATNARTRGPLASTHG